MSVRQKIEMIRFTVKQLFLSRKTAMLLVLSFFPLILVGAWMYDSNDQVSSEIFSSLFIAIFLQFIVLIVSLLYGTSLINTEISNKTISYLSTRSFRREELFLYRSVSAILVAFFVIVIPIVVSLVALSFYEGNLVILGKLLGYVAVVLLSVTVYVSFFSFIGVLLKRPLMAGLLFAFIWEILLANLPGKIPNMTVMFYLRSMSHHLIDATWPDYYPKAITTGGSVAVLTGVAIFFLFFGTFIFRHKNLVEKA